MSLPLPPGPPQSSPASSHTNTLAIISLVAGIGSFVAHIIPFVGGAVTAIIAIITGHLARKQIRASGEQGYGLATAGMVIGIIHLALLLIFLLVVVFLLVLAFSFLSTLTNTLPNPSPSLTT